MACLGQWREKELQLLLKRSGNLGVTEAMLSKGSRPGRDLNFTRPSALLPDRWSQYARRRRRPDRFKQLSETL
jgi:hypothetical protein